MHPIKPTSYLRESLYTALLRPQYLIPSISLTLTPQQIITIIHSQQILDTQSFFSTEQQQQIKSLLQKSANKQAYIKVNGRTAKDLPPIARQVNKVADVLQILHSSEYILQGLQEGEPADLVVRQYMPQLGDNSRVYQVYVRGGFTLAIGQKYCDHIQEQPTKEQIAKIFDIVQQIMPAITLTMPKNPSTQLNSFVLSLCMQPMPKITSIMPYPGPQHSIFTKAQLQTYYKQIQQQQQHLSQQQFYEINQRVIPLVRTITKQQDVKHYDMGEYLMGNEIEDQGKLNEWKEFIKEAEGKLKD